MTFSSSPRTRQTMWGMFDSFFNVRSKFVCSWREFEFHVQTVSFLGLKMGSWGLTWPRSGPRWSGPSLRVRRNSRDSWDSQISTGSSSGTLAKRSHPSLNSHLLKCLLIGLTLLNRPSTIWSNCFPLPPFWSRRTSTDLCGNDLTDRVYCWSIWVSLFCSPTLLFLSHEPAPLAASSTVHTLLASLCRQGESY